jgi:hypothetical protein
LLNSGFSILVSHNMHIRQKNVYWIYLIHIMDPTSNI